MKHLLSFLSILIISGNSFSQSLESYFHYAVFNSPQGPYLETYLSTIGETVVFAEKDNAFQAEIEVTLIFKQNDSVIQFEKYILKSPLLSNLEEKRPNFLDQQRIPIKSGDYNFEIQIQDINSELNPYKLNETLNVGFPENKLNFSGIQLLEDFRESTDETVLTKNGIDLIPYVSNFYPGNINSLKFYVELYNADAIINDGFLVRYFIKNDDTQEALPEIARFKRYQPKKYTPILGELNIETLKSGNYQLVVEVLDKTNKKIKEISYFFQRSKPLDPTDFQELDNFQMNQIFVGNMENQDSIKIYINALRPIATEREKQFIDHKQKTADLRILQSFFYAFWYERNMLDPGGEWEVYKKQIKIVDKLFATSIKRGYETDRGRVYLAYGPPNDSFQSGHEPSAYPYEIWSYYKLEDERNRKFVFYNPALAGNDFELLHSNMTGELKTPNWERYLNKRNNDLYNQDVRNSDDQWGNRALEYYNSH
jgi:GWxTD domain-containing protein